MKIVIYGINYAPELTGIGKYSGEMAEWLVEQGHEVRVVTAPPYYPEWKVSQGYVSNGYAKEDIHGVAVWRCPLYVPAVPSGLKRIVHLASFALSSLPVMLKQVFWKPDVVLVLEPPLFCSPTAWLVARLSRAQCWLHIQDFEVEAAFKLGIIPFLWLYKFVSMAELWMMKRFDRVSTISNAMLQHLKDKNISTAVLFPNWVDFSKIKYDAEGGACFRKNLGVDDPQCLCLYSGNISVKQGLEVLLEVATNLPGCHFVICGDGANRQSLQVQAESLALHNLSFLPLQPLNHFASMLSAADIHLVIQKKRAADLMMPSKLTNILAVGGLALVTAEEGSELGQLANEENGCVFRCDPESANALTETIVMLKDDKQFSDEIRTKAKAYAEQHIAKDQVLQAFERQLFIGSTPITC
jgi:putative colanic acid biosynthesis glycosyltransferase WcaI